MTTPLDKQLFLFFGDDIISFAGKAPYIGLLQAAPKSLSRKELLSLPGANLQFSD